VSSIKNQPLQASSIKVYDGSGVGKGRALRLSDGAKGIGHHST